MPEDINVPVVDEPRESRSREAFAGGSWFKVNLGRKQRAEPRWLLPMICKAGGVTKGAIGSIRIFDTETIFEVAADKVDSFLRNVGKNGTGEKGVHINAVDGPGERPDRPQTKRRPPGPPEKYDPLKPRPEKADRKQRYGSGKLKAEDFAVADQPRPPRPNSAKPVAKDKGKPKWAKPAQDGERPVKQARSKDHKKNRAPE